METVPFSTATDPPSVGSPGSVDAYYSWNARLPANKTGNHITALNYYGARHVTSSAAKPRLSA